MRPGELVAHIAILGPESCGKTTATRDLIDWLTGQGITAVAVAEAGRILGDALPGGHQWTGADQRATQLMHVGALAAADAVAHAQARAQKRDLAVVVCDGTAITPAVWHRQALIERPGYEGGPPELGTAITDTAISDAASYDLTLLLAPDLPAEPDPLRDNPCGRADALLAHEQLLAEAGVGWTLIRGTGTARRDAIRTAVAAIIEGRIRTAT